MDAELLGRLSGLTPTLSEQEAARSERDYEEAPELEGSALGADDRSLTDEQVAALISQEAKIKTVSFEVTGRRHYEKALARPTVPGGASGVTIGIGYDVGHTRQDVFRGNWQGHLATADIDRLSAACGLKGNAARARIGEFRTVVVPWDAALEVFQHATMPRFGRMVLKTFPNAIKLHPHSFGALFSLLLNRGNKLDGDRRKEMREIVRLMSLGSFGAVPEQFVKMAELWKGDDDLRGVVLRRKAEAVLFEAGLKALASAPLAAASTATAPGAPVLETLESLPPAAAATLESLDGDGSAYDEQAAERSKGMELETVPAWREVVWSKDDQSPDYSHIKDYTLAGTTFQFGAVELEHLIACNSFAPMRDNQRIVFALRGAQLVSGPGETKPQSRQVERERLTLRDVRPNHVDQRCVIGVYDLSTGRLSGFAASTVPHADAVLLYKTNQSSGNMMPTGCYKLVVGVHMRSKPERRVPGCLIEDTFRKAVLRNTNNWSYDVTDTWENNRSHGDNLHPAFGGSSRKFSSHGCLVIDGTYRPAPNGDRDTGTHEGEWAEFRRVLGLSPRNYKADHGKRFDVVLLTGLEAALATRQIAAGVTGDDPVLMRLRQGSRGERVSRMTRGLGLRETAVLDHIAIKEFADRQRRDRKPCDGIFSPALDADYKIGVFAPLAQSMASAGGGPTHEGLGRVAGYGAAATDQDALAYEIGRITETARRGSAADDVVNLESLNLELGFGALKLLGTDWLRQIETRLRDAVLGETSINGIAGTLGLQEQLDRACAGGLEAIRGVLLVGLRTVVSFVPGGSLLPLERIVDYVVENVVKSALASPSEKLHQGTQRLSEVLRRHWDESMARRYGTPARPEQDAPDAAEPRQGDEASKRGEPPPGGDDTSATNDLVCSLERSSKPVDALAMRRDLERLRQHIEKPGEQIRDQHAQRILKAICDSGLLAKLDGVAPIDPYKLIDDLETELRARPVNQRAVDMLANDIIGVLADPALPLQTEKVIKLLKAARSARQFELLAKLADRFGTRNSSILPAIAGLYAQGLIDSGRVVAGVQFLKQALEAKGMTAEEEADARGILGRGYKQIYVNHVRTPSEAVALSDTFGPQLQASIDCYARHYDESRAVQTNYQGINLIALLKRAERDRITVTSNASADRLAKHLIEQLTPAAETGDDVWMLASLGEAHLALDRYDDAARYYGLYANHPRVDAFQLAGTIRQLEEVWQLRAAPNGAGAIVAGLKARLAAAERGFLRLDADELHALKNATTFDFGHHFEAMTDGGKMICFHMLRQIVRCGTGVAAIQRRIGQSGQTIGTGFLVKGSDFSPTLKDDVSYVLTNAHVLWRDGASGERNAIAPEEARVIFETDHVDGRNDFYIPTVVWQSPSSSHDATLISLGRKVEHMRPLDLAVRDKPLRVAAEGTKSAGTRLGVLGHPLGNALKVGVHGAIDETHGTLIDCGPKSPLRSPEFLHYTTPTEPGNSGSPVLETDGWTVVALHHAGFSRSGSGLPRLNGKAGSTIANEGILIHSIVDEARRELADKPERRGLFRWTK